MKKKRLKTFCQVGNEKFLKMQEAAGPEGSDAMGEGLMHAGGQCKVQEGGKVC